MFCLAVTLIVNDNVDSDISPLNRQSEKREGVSGVDDMEINIGADPWSMHRDREASGSSDQPQPSHGTGDGNAPVVIVKDPGTPTQSEVDEHDKTHLPYRSWCPVCVMAKGKEDGHFSRETVDKGRPIVAFDFKSFGQDPKEDDKLTALVMRDRVTKTTCAHLCLHKGSSDTWVVEKVLEDLDALGHVEVILKGDGEPALQQVLREVKRKRIQPTLIQAPPAYDPQSNGVAEHAVQEYIGHLRTIKLALERRTGEKLPTNSPMMQWASEHAPFLISRYQLGHDGKTAYRRLMGKDAKNKIVEFGEQVLAKPMRSKRMKRKVALRSKWVAATWVGATRNSNEHIVVLAEGGPAIRVRTVKRRPMPDRWNVERLNEVRATPRCPNPKNEEQKIPLPERETAGVEVHVEEKPEVPETQVEECKDTERREFRITKQLISKYGVTDGCAGCAAHSMGMKRDHNAMCRVRFEGEMLKDSDLEKRISGRDARLGKQRIDDETSQTVEEERNKDDQAEVIAEDAEASGSEDDNIVGGVADVNEPNEQKIYPETTMLADMLSDSEHGDEHRIREEIDASRSRLDDDKKKHEDREKEEKIEGDDRMRRRSEGDAIFGESSNSKKRKIAMAGRYRKRAIGFCSRFKSMNSVDKAVKIMADLDEDNRPSLIGSVKYHSSDNPSNDKTNKKWIKYVCSTRNVNKLQ